MATKKAQTPAQKAAQTPVHTEQPAALYAVVTDYLVNPSSDTPLSGDLTRAELEGFGIDVDDLVNRGILEATDRVRQAA